MIIATVKDRFEYGDDYTEEELDRLAKDTSGTPHGSVLALIEQLRFYRDIARAYVPESEWDL